MNHMADRNSMLSRLFRLVRLASDFMQAGYRKTYASEPVFRIGAVRSRAGLAVVPPTAEQTIERIDETVRDCTKCRLHMTRKKAVPGEGTLDPFVLVIGEAPGQEEDLAGRPFIGPAGRYLSKWIEAIGLDRVSHCYITNVVKCRPPQNRQPSDDECGACFPYLEEQVETLRPKTILCVGLVSARMLTRRANTSMATLRERAYELSGIPLFVTYHPSAVLRDQSLRKAVWEDLKKLQAVLAQNP
jgi:uracil-DNA glycosylase family 4